MSCGICHVLFMSIATADIRRRAIAAYRNGKGTQAGIAHSYNVDIRTFQRWLARFATTRESAPRPRGHRLALFRGERLAALDQLVQDHPDATLDELRVASNVNGSIMSVKRALDRLGYRYKKNASRQRTRPRRRPAAARAMA
jgi:transposase